MTLRLMSKCFSIHQRILLFRLSFGFFYERNVTKWHLNEVEVIGIAGSTVETTIRPLYWILKFIERWKSHSALLCGQIKRQNNSTFFTSSTTSIFFPSFFSLSTEILMLAWQGIGRGKAKKLIYWYLPINTWSGWNRFRMPSNPDNFSCESRPTFRCMPNNI